APGFSILIRKLRTYPRQFRLCAFPDDGEETIEVAFAHKRIWTAWLAEIQSVQLVQSLVIKRMECEVDIGVRFRGDILKSFGGCDPGFERVRHRREIPHTVASHIRIDTTPQGANMPFVSVLERDQRRNSSRRVARCDV